MLCLYDINVNFSKEITINLICKYCKTDFLLLKNGLSSTVGVYFEIVVCYMVTKTYSSNLMLNLPVLFVTKVDKSNLLF